MNVRKFFQCSLRDLLWLFVLAAIVTCWHKDRISQEQRVVARIAETDAERSRYQKAIDQIQKLQEQTQAIAANIEGNRQKQLEKLDDLMQRTRRREPPDIYFLGPLTTAERTPPEVQSLEDENKALRLTVRELESKLAEQENP